MVSLVVGAKHMNKWHTGKLHAPSTRPNETNTIPVPPPTHPKKNVSLNYPKSNYLKFDQPHGSQSVPTRDPESAALWYTMHTPSVYHGSAALWCLSAATSTHPVTTGHPIGPNDHALDSSSNNKIFYINSYICLFHFLCLLTKSLSEWRTRTLCSSYISYTYDAISDCFLHSRLYSWIRT